MSRLLALVLTIVLLLAGAAAQAQSKVKVGVLKLTSSAPIFVGVEKGFFKEFGVDPELVYFQAAAPIATALAAGAVEVGATGLTAALYNIVLQGEKLWIVADKGREWAGFPLVGIVVQKELWESGKVRSIKDLKGRTIGVTQLGSTFHYHIGNILEKEGLALGDVRIVPLQAMPWRRSRASRWTPSWSRSRSPAPPRPRASARCSSGRAICISGRSPPSSTRSHSPPIARRRWPS
jgi:NitT/TauT family transport system substrate-binding protein